MEQRNFEPRRSLWRPLLWAVLAVALVLAVVWALSTGRNAFAVTGEEAIAAALADAGVAESDATALRCRADAEGRLPHYEVEFTVGTEEYDYDIHAETGKILSRDVDRKETAAQTQAQEAKPETAPGSTPAAQSGSAASAAEPPADRLTAEEALSMAYADAGVTAGQASGVECELDRENGRWVYEISFDVGPTEYEFDLDAVTGDILLREVDQ